MVGSEGQAKFWMKVKFKWDQLGVTILASASFSTYVSIPLKLTSMPLTI